MCFAQIVLDNDKEVELRPQAGRRHSHRTAGVWEEDIRTTNVYENVKPRPTNGKVVYFLCIFPATYLNISKSA